MWMTISIMFTSIFMTVGLWACVSAHGRLLNPPARGSMWRLGFETPVNYNDHELYCGGYARQWVQNRGRCGECGDPWDLPRPRPNEAGGKLSSGIVSRVFRRGQIMMVTVQLTANHQGWFEFRLCPNNDAIKYEKQSCLNKHVLSLVDFPGRRYQVKSEPNNLFNIRLQLPPDVVCNQCVLQWHYTTGNNWGICMDGSQRVGCGPQEVFRGCADVAIYDQEDPTYYRFLNLTTGFDFNQIVSAFSAPMTDTKNVVPNVASVEELMENDIDTGTGTLLDLRDEWHVYPNYFNEDPTPGLKSDLNKKYTSSNNFRTLLAGHERAIQMSPTSATTPPRFSLFDNNLNANKGSYSFFNMFPPTALRSHTTVGISDEFSDPKPYSIISSNSFERQNPTSKEAVPLFPLTPKKALAPPPESSRNDIRTHQSKLPSITAVFPLVPTPQLSPPPPSKLLLSTVQSPKNGGFNLGSSRIPGNLIGDYHHFFDSSELTAAPHHSQPQSGTTISANKQNTIYQEFQNEFQTQIPAGVPQTIHNEIPTSFPDENMKVNHPEIPQLPQIVTSEIFNPIQQFHFPESPFLIPNQTVKVSKEILQVPTKNTAVNNNKIRPETPHEFPIIIPVQTPKGLPKEIVMSVFNKINNVITNENLQQVDGEHNSISEATLSEEKSRPESWKSTIHTSQKNQIANFPESLPTQNILTPKPHKTPQVVAGKLTDQWSMPHQSGWVFDFESSENTGWKPSDSLPWVLRTAETNPLLQQQQQVPLQNNFENSDKPKIIGNSPTSKTEIGGSSLITSNVVVGGGSFTASNVKMDNAQFKSLIQQNRFSESSGSSRSQLRTDKPFAHSWSNMQLHTTGENNNA